LRPKKGQKAKAQAVFAAATRQFVDSLSHRVHCGFYGCEQGLTVGIDDHRLCAAVKQ
jgi:hypothetical protein